MASRISFDAQAGGKKWRRAVHELEKAGRQMEVFRPDQAAAPNVVSLDRVRSATRMEDYRIRSARMRAAADRVLALPAPTPGELASKIKLLAYVEGLADPVDNDGNPGSATLESAMSRLWWDAALLHQFHDKDRFGKRGAR